MRLSGQPCSNAVRFFALATAFLLIAGSAAGATITVNDSTSTVHNAAGECSLTGAGTCSLADAINYSNSTAGGNTINFSVNTINLTVTIPDVTKPVTIDGAFGAPRVEVIGAAGVSGFNITSGAGGLLPGSGTTLKNLVIRNMSGAGISITDGGNQVLNCYIGTDKAGTAAQANGGAGVSITTTAGSPYTLPLNLSAAGFNWIGNPGDPTSGNLISGNSGVGISISGQRTVLNVVAYNMIGTDKNGTSAIANGSHGIEITGDAFSNTIGPGNVISGNTNANSDGIFISGSVLAPNIVTTNIIGPAVSITSIGNARDGVRIESKKADVSVGDVVELGPANIIGWNQEHGVMVTNSAEKVYIFGNFIGVVEFPASSGTIVDIGNAMDGIRLTTSGHQIGGTTAIETNVIAANNNSGIALASAVTDVVIKGNIIGRDPFNLTDQPNTLDGITVANSGNNTIGGTSLAANVIAGNTRNGIKITSSGTGWANLITGNSIFGNGKMGIDLDWVVEGADPINTDPNNAYANHGQNAPVVGSGVNAPSYDSMTGKTTVKWTLATTASTPVTLEFFGSDASDPSGFGEGQVYLGTATTTTDGAGNAAGTTVVTPPSAYDSRGKYITMTATPTNAELDLPGPTAGGPANNTSEFSNAVLVPDPATHYGFVVPAAATAGVGFNFTINALTASNAIDTTYTGTVHFTSSDPGATVPADIALVAGTGTFAATLTTVGIQTLSGTDTVTPALTGTSAGITVTAGAATHYTITAPAAATTGVAFNYTVTALDAFNNTATGYAGTVHFTSSDGAAVLPGDSTLTNGVGTLSATLNTAGNQTITGTDTVTPAITGTSNTINVSAAAATHFDVVAPANATAGGAFNFTVTARTATNTVATGYAGTVHFTTTDAQGVLPADAVLVAGVGTFSATLKTAGNQTITATDTVTPAITGTSGNILVAAGAATHFTVVAPANAVAGVAFNYTVTALDAFNNTATAYAGIVHFTTTDGAATLPADAGLVSGAGTFSATLKTAGNQTITGTDTVTPAITGTSANILVSAAAATHFSVVAPAGANPGTPFNFTVTALDAFNNVATTYAGTVHFTSSDGAAVLPADSALVSGVATLPATLNTAGNQTITATDTVAPAITGTSNNINVSAGAATHFGVAAPATATAGTPFNFTVTALTATNAVATGYAGTVHFTTTDGQGVLPADATLVNGVGTFPATLKTAGIQTITATDTVTPAITGVSGNIVVSAAAANHFTIVAPAGATPGVAFNFTVTALDPFNNVDMLYAGTVHFTSSDGAAVLPANSTLTNGVATLSATLNTAGNQTITGTDTVTPAITGTSNVIAVAAAAATHFSITAPANAAPGASFNFTVTALTAANLTATSYSGTVHFTTTDGAAVMPADSVLVNGVGTFPATLNTAGNQTITGTDTVTPAITGTSGTIVVAAAAAATHFSVTAPATATAGTPFNYTVTALDAGNNVVVGYAGTVHFTSSDTQAVLPADATLVNGVGTFPATLKTVGTQTITATDTVTASITGTSGPIAVSAGAATHFSINAPAAAFPGGPFNITVTALDAFNNVATGYAGTVHLTSSDGAAVLPADSLLTNGVATFSITLNTAGGQTVTATDTVTPAITGVSAQIMVGAVPGIPMASWQVLLLLLAVLAAFGVMAIRRS